VVSATKRLPDSHQCDFTSLHEGASSVKAGDISFAVLHQEAGPVFHSG
jgi:hypothetical protein